MIKMHYVKNKTESFQASLPLVIQSDITIYRKTPQVTKSKQRSKQRRHVQLAQGRMGRWE